jgi:excisionase family DNA binding protein
MSDDSSGQQDRLLSAAEAAAMLRVDPKTITRWAKQGRLHSVRTLGGDRRYPASDVRRLREPPDEDPGAGVPARLR